MEDKNAESDVMEGVSKFLSSRSSLKLLTLATFCDIEYTDDKNGTSLIKEVYSVSTAYFLLAIGPSQTLDRLLDNSA